MSWEEYKEAIKDDLSFWRGHPVPAAFFILWFLFIVLSVVANFK